MAAWRLTAPKGQLPAPGERSERLLDYPYSVGTPGGGTKVEDDERIIMMMNASSKIA